MTGKTRKGRRRSGHAERGAGHCLLTLRCLSDLFPRFRGFLVGRRDRAYAPGPSVTRDVGTGSTEWERSLAGNSPPCSTCHRKKFISLRGPKRHSFTLSWLPDDVNRISIPRSALSRELLRKVFVESSPSSKAGSLENRHWYLDG